MKLRFYLEKNEVSAVYFGFILESTSSLDLLIGLSYFMDLFLDRFLTLYLKG
jgi:hypothetical protein